MAKRIDPQDIVNTIITNRKIIKYIGMSRQIVKDLSHPDGERNIIHHWYETECQRCGCRNIIDRATLSGRKCNKGEKCPHCAAVDARKAVTREAYEKGREVGAETMRCNPNPTKRNCTTGIKHYCIGIKREKRCGNVYIYFQHIIDVMINKKRYKVLQTQTYTPEVLDSFVVLANKVNETLHTGGKEAFLEWYKKGEWKQ